MIILFILSLAGCILTLFSYDEKDKKAYRKLIDDEIQPSDASQTSRHRHSNLRKDFYYSNGKDRLQLQLKSVEAELKLEQQEGEKQIIEHMRDVCCYMQEKVYKTPSGNTMQQVRYLEADAATYQYHKNQFAAQNVKLCRYLVPGNKLQETAEGQKLLISGVADWVEFSLGANEPNFKAHRIQSSFYSFLNSEEEMVFIDAQMAEYDGKKISLDENVNVKHQLGNIFADHVLITETPELKNNAYGMINMHDNVKVSFKEGGEITCSDAVMDYGNLKGTFSGIHDQDYVVYSENCCTEKEQDLGIPLVVKGKRMIAQLANNNLTSQTGPKSSIDSIKTENDVTINYNNDLTAYADEAFYQRTTNVANKESALQLSGLITVKNSKNNGQCKLTNKQGDVICANEMKIDTLSGLISFDRPHGIIQENLGKLIFSADFLQWDELHQILVLKGNVEVDYQGFGQFRTTNEIRIARQIIAGRKHLKSIESPSNTILTYLDSQKNNHKVKCPGLLLLDHQNMHAVLKGEDNQQVVFEDSKGEIAADNAKINYQKIEKKLLPKMLNLDGNVRLYNHFAPNSEETSSVLQYALADHLQYLPEANEMIFKANGQNRVLFYDKVNNIEVSAPGIKLFRDQATGKEVIKGIGNVRFSFVEREFEQLKQRFLMLQNLQE